MDDKTSSRLQPSTPFDDSSSSTKHSQHPLNPTSTSSSTSVNAILSTPTKPSTMEQKKSQIDIASLMSPPEAAPMESFSHTPGPAKTAPTEPLLLSPPISPEDKGHTAPEDLSAVVIRDPILFDSQSSPITQPSLFVEDAENRQIVQKHIAARQVDSFREASPPRTSEYQLALEFKSKVAELYSADRKKWRMREMAQLREDHFLMSGRRYPPIAPAVGGRQARASKPTIKVKDGVKKPRAPKLAPTVRAGTPGGDRRVAREDKDFDALPDFSPPIKSLPNRPNSLKVEWRGAPVDLRSDPHAHLLHPDELSLASNLRLDCATYLTSKRRVFQKRIDCLRIGKEFRKTDAQQACKIDVNKASKLWTAFDKVGWLNPKWVAKYA